jgi:hypothetical protein
VHDAREVRQRHTPEPPGEERRDGPLGLGGALVEDGRGSGRGVGG